MFNPCGSEQTWQCQWMEAGITSSAPSIPHAATPMYDVTVRGVSTTDSPSSRAKYSRVWRGCCGPTPLPLGSACAPCIGTFTDGCQRLGIQGAVVSHCKLVRAYACSSCGAGATDPRCLLRKERQNWTQLHIHDMHALRALRRS